jgi:MFS family permease
VVVSGPDCSYSPFAVEQATDCGKLLADLAGAGVSYKLAAAPDLGASVAGKPLPLDTYPWADKAARGKQLQAWLSEAGYDFAKAVPSLGQALTMIAALLLMMALSGATYGPVAALLSEMFPPHVRYSSMSIPYHIGTGYFGGFLPLISSYIVAKTGDPYAGLWYTWGVVLVAFLVAAWGLKSGAPRDYGADAA